MNVPLDGTVFEASKGYNRPTNSNPIPYTDTQTQDMIAFIGDYPLTTLVSTINAMNFTYASTIYGVPFNVSLAGPTPMDMKFLNGTFTITVNPTITVAKIFSFEAAMTLDVAPTVSAGSSSYICKVYPGV